MKEIIPQLEATLDIDSSIYQQASLEKQGSDQIMFSANFPMQDSS